jgi:mannose-6-phosphate isomerase class I
MIDYAAVDRVRTFARARQVETPLRSEHGSRETRLLNADVLDFFDATRLDVEDELSVADGRFSIDVVVAGEGSIEGESGAEPIRAGETVALAASLAHRYRAGGQPLRIVRCMGPDVT